MNIEKRVQDIEKVFNQSWKANNYSQNGITDKIKSQQDSFNRMYNIKPKEDRKKEILAANSVQGKIEQLNKNMNTLKNFSNGNRFN